MSDHRIFALALLIVSMLFTMPAFADATGIKPRIVAVGTSQYVWALDSTDNKILYRRNPTTFRYDEVDAAKAIWFIDVSLNGTVVMAGNGSQLYFWDDSSQSLQVHPTTQGIGQVAVGKSEIWGRQNNNLYRFDPGSGQFELKGTGRGHPLAIGKEDDSVWNTDTANRIIYQYDFDSQAWLEKAVLNDTTQIVWLTARNEKALWVLDNHGSLYQYDAKAGVLVNQTAKIPSNLGLTQIAIDEHNVIYGVTPNGIVFIDTKKFAIDTRPSRQTIRPVSVIDADGTQHVIFSQGQKIYHSYAPLSQTARRNWVQAKAIPASQAGSDLNLAVDNNGTLHASWLAGSGNDKEIYYAQGVKNPDVGGYDWSTATQVSNDQAGEQGLTMTVTPSGNPVFFTSKWDHDALLGDRDNYQHLLNLSDEPPTFGRKPLHNTYRENLPLIYQEEPLGSILNSAASQNNLLGGSFKGTILPMGSSFGYTFEFKEGLELQVIANLASFAFKEGKAGIAAGLTARIEWVVLEDPKTIVVIIPDVSYRYYGDQALLTSLEIELEFYFPMTPLDTELAKIEDYTGIVFNYGFLVKFVWTTAEVVVSFDGGEEGENGEGGLTELCFGNGNPELAAATFPTFIQARDKAGNSPPAPGTPVSDMSVSIDWQGFGEFIEQLLVGGVSSSGPQAPTSGQLGAEVESEIASNWSLGAGLYGDWAQKEEGHSIIGAHFRFLVSMIGDPAPAGYQEFVRVWLTPGPFIIMLFQAKFNEKINATLAYSPGGTTTAYAPGALLGSGAGTNAVDEGRIDVATIGNTAVGVFKQETGDSSFEAIYFLQGEIDPNSGAITWDENSLYRLPNSGGFNSDPEITFYQSGQANKLLVAWGGVPDTDPSVQKLAKIPPGKAYLVMGQDAGSTTQLDKLTTSPNSTGFYYSNHEAIYAIGASVAALGDVDGGGKPDFIIGAPDAEVEEGRAYVIFGENYDKNTTAAIDARNGSQGLVLAGDIDSELGYAAASAGDFNRDGKPDLAISAPGANNHAGAVYVLYGGSDLAGSSEIVDISGAVPYGPQPVSVPKGAFDQSNQKPADLLSTGDFRLSWQQDGNLALYASWLPDPIWSTKTQNRGTECSFQGDGNLVIYGSSGALWGSQTADGQHNNNGGRQMILYPNGNLAIVNGVGQTLWETGTGDQPAFLPRGSFDHSNKNPADLLVNGDYRLSWEQDGNLVLYDRWNPVWSSNTQNRGTELAWQGDGNLVLRDVNTNAIWASNTADGEHNNNGGRNMLLYPNGRLVIVDATGATVPSTHNPIWPGASQTTLTAGSAPTLSGRALSGMQSGSRLGSALAGGFDVSGDGYDDLLIGSAEESAVYLYLAPDEPPLKFTYASSAGQPDPGRPLGNDLAMTPDINGDGAADLLFGSAGNAYLLFGGQRLTEYAKGYVTTWTAEGEGSEQYKVVLSFAGSDNDNDGILRARAASPGSNLKGGYQNEMAFFTMEVFKSDSLLKTWSYADQAQSPGFNFNFDLSSNQVLAGGDLTEPEGINIGGPGYNLFSGANGNIGSEELIQLYSSDEQANLACSYLGDNLFAFLSQPGSFDLRHINDIPILGVVLQTVSGALLHVSAAGDVNKDNLGDMLIGYGNSTDMDQNPIAGKGYLIYGNSDLNATGQIDLDQIAAGQGTTLAAGGAVGGAGDVNGDSVADVIVADPAPISGNTNVYVYLGAAGADPTLRWTMTNTDTSELVGVSLTSVGDLNGDGKAELLLGSPYSVDNSIIDSLIAKTRIMVSLLPHYGSNANWATSMFSGTQALGVAPAAVDRTGSGGLLTWVEPSGDSVAVNNLYGAFITGSSWGPSTLIQSTTRDINYVTISDQSNLSAQAKSAPTVVWQESDPQRANQPTMFQGVYDPIAQTWTVTAMDISPALEAPGAPDNPDATLSVGGSEFQVEDAVAPESAGEATVTIRRSGSLTEAQELFYRTVDLSATAGADYEHTAGVLRFAPGEQFKRIKIKVYPDKDRENGGEHLQIELRSVHPLAHRSWNGRRIFGAPVTTGTLQLSEDDRVEELGSIDSGFIMSGDSDVLLGDALSPAGDVNGDGVGDFLAAAPALANHAGRVYLVYGRQGIEIQEMGQPLDYLRSSQGVVFSGSETGGQAGAAVAAGKAGSPFIAIGAPGTDQSQGKVYVYKYAQFSGTNAVTLNASSPLVLSGGSAGDLFGSTMVAADVDNNGQDDLVIIAPGDTTTAGSSGRVYVVYDSYLNSGTSGVLNGSNANIDIITNSAGVGFGKALAVGDFNGDTFNELVLGAPLANPLTDARGVNRGSGGYVYVVWGKGKSSKLGSIDLNNLGSAGRTFVGQAALSPGSSTASGDGDTRLPSQNLMPGSGLLDFIGDAVALLDFDGSGGDELVIGAPEASVAGADGVLTMEDSRVGRVYVLFGGSSWKSSNEPYQLTTLYGSDYKKGLVLEGMLTGGKAGSSLANVGAVRGTTDSGCEDLLIGAPTVGSNAGQAYLVFGSTNHYDMSNAVAGDNVQWLDPTGDANHPNVPLLFSYQGIVNPLTADNPTNSGNVGRMLSGAGDINGDGAADILIGAPTASVDGAGQLYIPIGHPWIIPGQHLNVKDLRSDNGFVLEGGAIGAPVGDFNGDGYDDIVMIGERPELVLGATALANANGVRRIPLFSDYHFNASWSSSGYTVEIDFDGEDLDGDNVLRGRGSDPSQVSGGFGNEITAWKMTVSKNGTILMSVDITPQMQRSDFNFNFDLARNEVIAEGDWSKPNGLNAGIWGVANQYNFTSDAGSNRILLENKDYSTLVASSGFGSGNFTVTENGVPEIRRSIYSTRFPQTKSGEIPYFVFIAFTGSDRDGDGYIRGRSPNSTLTPAYNNELTQLAVVFSNDYQGSYPRYPTQTYDLATLQAMDKVQNLNYYVKSKQVMATDYPDKPNGINLGSDLSNTWQAFSQHTNIQTIRYSTQQIWNNPYALNLTVNLYPVATYLPPAAGDFNGDGQEDFVLFSSVGSADQFTFITKNTPHLTAWVFDGSSNPAQTAAAPVQQTIPLHYVSNALAGDINGDGYQDVVFSGYDLATDKGMLYSVNGSPAGLNFNSINTIYTETDGTARYLLALLDITNNGQDDIVTCTVLRSSGRLPLNFYFTPTTIYTYGGKGIGEAATWHGPIDLQSAIFANTGIDLEDMEGIFSGRPVDIDGDGFVDLGMTFYSDNSSESPPRSFVLHSTGDFTFVDGLGNWKTTAFIYNDDIATIYGGTDLLSSPGQMPRMTGITDFNMDGIDDLLITANRGINAKVNNGPAYSYIIYGSPDLPGQVYHLDLQNDKFTQGMAIEGLEGVTAPYTGVDAGDMNGDGFGDIFMADIIHGLSYGVYGSRVDESATVNYIEGSEDDDVLQQAASTQTGVNLWGKGGNDFIQTVRTVEGSTRPYEIVVHGGPGDDQIGISTVQADFLKRIDGGHGFDELFLNPVYTGGAETLDLTAVGRRISGIEMIDLGNTNGLEFGFLEISNLSDETNTLLVRGTDARAKPVEGNWAHTGQSTHDGVVYDVYEYQPESGSSDIQVWIEQDGVLWLPLQ